MKKKSIIGYGNSHATELTFCKFGRYPDRLEIPCILKKPLDECKIKVRITIEEV